MRTRIPKFTLEVRREALARIRRQFQGITSDAELARLMGIDQGQMSRVLLGKSEPGTRFIAQLLGVLGIEFFTQIFALIPDTDENQDGEMAS